MKDFLLRRIRLSTYFWIFFIVYLLLSFVLPEYKFDAGSLALFSVNSFLYGFYISPILGAQKNRIDSIHQTIRSEATALFDLVLDMKRLPDHTRNQMQAMVTSYVHAKLHSKKMNGGEKEYEDIISFCVEYKGQETNQVEAVLSDLVKNQQNRTNFNMHIGNKIFANEWHIVVILFSITLAFILSISIPHNYFMEVVRALLCTGLTLLVINLIKLNTLTHKKAKQMWLPLQKLTETNFYRID